MTALLTMIIPSRRRRRRLHDRIGAWTRPASTAETVHYLLARLEAQTVKMQQQEMVLAAIEAADDELDDDADPRLVTVQRLARLALYGTVVAG